MSNARLLLSASVVLVAIFLLISWLSTSSQNTYEEVETITENAQDFEDLENRFQSLAREKGGVYAYEVLRRALLPPNTDMHLLGHAIGNELYKEKGVEGIADCTQDFRNACSHSIVVGTLNDFGETALPMIREACKKAPGGSGAYTMCYHGLGHGVFAFFGYDLGPTIDFCEKTGTSEYHRREYIECVGGSIMELMGGGGHDRDAWLRARETYLSAASPLSPCMDKVIPDDAKPQCLTYLTPHFWELAGINMGSPEPALFAKAFSYCEKIPSSQKKLRDACFGGFGKEFIVIAGGRDVRDVASYSDEMYRTTIQWCSYAAPNDGKRACIKDAISSVFWGGENDPNASFRFCGLVEDSSMKDACYEELATAIDSYTEGETRATLCARLPAHQDTCSQK